MKVAALAALSVLIALPVEAGQRHRQNGSPATTCDNNGHCTVLDAAAPMRSHRESRLETQRTIATAQHQSRALDANGNTAGCSHISQDRRACSRWHRLCRTFSGLYR